MGQGYRVGIECGDKVWIVYELFFFICVEFGEFFVCDVVQFCQVYFFCYCKFN